MSVDVWQEVRTTYYLPEKTIWDDIPTLGITMREQWHYRSRHWPSLLHSDSWSPQEWVRFNKFSAIAAVAIGLHSNIATRFVAWGLDVLRSTLQIQREVEKLEDNIPSAVIDTNRGENVPWYAYRGPPGLHEERWKFWEKQFAAYSMREDLSENAREWGAKAAKKISELRMRQLKDNL
ncbi:hypothetical protein BJ875DRAFT_480971 [Amylocarpus encephaloides]|uniref:Uncharacterized protein n=1 Tax=Amylocarpus encephaloides TaxID=45428 RepID=A0A9P7YPW6_9HELO|nr:hypothetical protein BJ875DRAFT_480971 [Amylocarpus encephaloides]